MCLAVPARILRLSEDGSGSGGTGVDGFADVELEGVVKQVSLALVEDVAVGDYVIVHVGFALSRLDPVEAKRTLALIAEARAAA